MLTASTLSKSVSAQPFPHINVDCFDPFQVRVGTAFSTLQRYGPPVWSQIIGRKSAIVILISIIGLRRDSLSIKVPEVI